jgi:hypothetical protein
MIRPKNRILIITHKDYSQLIYYTFSILLAGAMF